MVHRSVGLRTRQSTVDYVGVISGDTSEVRRSRALHDVPPDIISSWATNQASLIRPENYMIFDLIRACHEIISLGGDSKELPFCFLGGEFVTYADFRRIVGDLNHLHMPLDKAYSDNFSIVKIGQLGTSYFVHKPVEQIIAVDVGRSHHIFEDWRGKEICSSLPADISHDDLRGSHLSQYVKSIMDEVSSIWESTPNLRIETQQVFQDEFCKPPSERWVLSLTKQNKTLEIDTHSKIRGG